MDGADTRATLDDDEIEISVIDTAQSMDMLDVDGVHRLFSERYYLMSKTAGPLPLAEWLSLEHAVARWMTWRAKVEELTGSTGSEGINGNIIKRYANNEMLARFKMAHVVRDESYPCGNVLILPIWADEGGDKIGVDPRLVFMTRAMFWSVNAFYPDIAKLEYAPTCPSLKGVSFTDCFIRSDAILPKFDENFVTGGFQNADSAFMFYWSGLAGSWDRTEDVVKASDLSAADAHALMKSCAFAGWLCPDKYYYLLATLSSGASALLPKVTKLRAAEIMMPRQLEYSALMTSLENIFNYKFAYESVDADMTQLNLLLEHDDTALDIIRRVHERRVALKKYRFDQTVKRTEYGMLMKIIIAKINRKPMFDKIKTAAYKYGTKEGLLSLLSADEKRLVTTEYEKTMAYIRESSTNKCEHKRVSRVFMETGNGYDKLKNFIDTKDAKSRDDYLHCSVCGFKLICPHYLVRELNSSRPFKEQRAELEKYMISTTIQACRICGEDMSGGDNDDDVDTTLKSDVIDIDENFYNMLHGEAMQMVRFLTSHENMPVPAIVKTICRRIYEPLMIISKKIEQSKTETENVIKMKLKIYIAIYVMAAMAYMVEEGMFGVRFAKGHDGKDIPNKPAQLLEYVYKLLIVSKNPILNQVQSMTNKLIKETLVIAYRHMRVGVSLPEEVVEVDPIDTLALGLDPMYIWIAEVYRRAKLRVLLADELLEETLAAEAAISKKKKNTRGYKVKSKQVTSHIGLRGFYDKVHIPTLKGKDQWSRIAEIILSSLQQGVFFQPALDWTVDPPIPSAKYKSMYDELEPILAADRASTNINIMRTWVAPYILPVENPWYYERRGLRVSINTTYDGNGKKHKWRYDSRDDSGEPVFKCTVCEAMSNDLSALADDQVWAAVRAVYNFDDFYRYYDKKCPVNDEKSGDLHTMVDGVCSKCEYTIGERSKDYYNKWADQFEDARKKKALPSFAPPVDFVPPGRVEWEYNFNFILSVAQELGVDHRLIINMGAVEGVLYNDVTAGAYVAVDADDHYNTRNFRLRSYVNTIIVGYNKLRNYNHLLRPPREYDPLVADLSISDLDSLSELSSISDDYQEMYNGIFFNMKPKEMTNFLLQYICLLLDRIIKTPGRWSELMGELARYLCKKILDSDSVTSKALEFSWSLVYPKLSSEINDTGVDADDAEGVDLYSDGAAAEDEAEPGPMDDTLDTGVEDDELDADDPVNQIRVEFNVD